MNDNLGLHEEDDLIPTSRATMDSPAVAQRNATASTSQEYCAVRGGAREVRWPWMTLVTWWRWRYAFQRLTRRAVDDSLANSRWGWLWVLVEPAALMAAYAWFIGQGDRSAGGESTARTCAGLCLSLTLAQYASFVLGRAPRWLELHRALVTRVAFPVEILPLSCVATAAVRAGPWLGLSLVAVAIVGGLGSLALVRLMLVFVCLTALLVGASYLLAAAGVFYRELRLVTPLVARFLFYFSPLFHLAAVGRGRDGPMMDPLSAVQLGGAASWLLASLVVSIALTLLGHWVFVTFEPRFADEL